MIARQCAVALLLAGMLPGDAARAEGIGMKQMDMEKVVPALAAYRQTVVIGDLWKRPDLSPRDRSIVTVAALIARNQNVELQQTMEVALDNGVTAQELSEIITHLAFYAGWDNAMGAVTAAGRAFDARGIDLKAVSPVQKPLPLDEAAEADRAKRVDEQFGAFAPGLVHYTTDVLFRDLWLRPALAPRDRSLVTVSALIATGQVAQITYHLNRAMDNGLTREEAGEVLGHLAFYAGWPNAFSAAPVVKDVIEKRPR
jgi:4-carboxymuconolactone decarboxylase